MKSFALLFVLLLLPAVASASSLRFRATDTASVELTGEALDSMTLELWLRPSAAAQSALPVYIGSFVSPSPGFGLIVHDGYGSSPGRDVSVVLGGIAYSVTGNWAKLDSGIWTHIALVRRDTIWLLYRNGMLIGRGTARPLTAPPVLFIGRAFRGDIDEVRLWNRALDPEEIRTGCIAHLSGSESGLRLWLPMDASDTAAGTLRNRALSTGSSFDVRLGTASFTPDEPPLASGPAPHLGFDAFPHPLQFYPGPTDPTPVPIRGRVLDRGFDSIACELFRDGTRIRLDVRPLSYAGATAAFSFDVNIRPELAQYTVRLSALIDGQWRYAAEAPDIVSGDVILIAGQSNSHPTNSGETFSNDFIRSYGWQTPRTNYDRYDPADTSWGVANGHGYGRGFSGPYLIGVWGMELARSIILNTERPICIINGGAGGSSIELNLRNDSNPTDLATIYGRTLWRTQRAGVREAVSEIFWYQGESNTIDGYARNFDALRSAWHQDFPNLRQIYLFQIRPGCGGEHSALRDLQRRLPWFYEDVLAIATAGIHGHDGCHFTLQGYKEIASAAYAAWCSKHCPVLDSSRVEWPNVTRAWYTTLARDEVAISFATGNTSIVWPADTVIAGKPRRIEDAFILDSATTGFVASGRASRDTVFLRLKGPSTARAISYIPSKFYIDTSVVYEGPWLTRPDGLGALTFYRVPIDAPAGVTVPSMPSAATLVVAPNPAYAGTLVELTIARPGPVRIVVTDAIGNTITTLHNGVLGAGTSSFRISPEALQPGAYRCTAIGGDFVVQSGFVAVE